MWRGTNQITRNLITNDDQEEKKEFLLLLELALSFAGVNEVKLPQANGTHTRLPVWHSPIQNSGDNIYIATVSFGSILMVISGDGNKYPTIEFDRYLTSYCLITALTEITYVPIDIVQVLCSDYAFVIQFTRMYFNTFKEYKHGYENHQRWDNTSGENALAGTETIDLDLI
ncbi:hypothetical protein GLOIN_2v1532168 [Rhizophagus clarus]|uniref:Uncharacterized protein n=1 Tax=Rhizophagus clarus TaxID=94130 RepID=A0A8H3QJ32_9GLOM|nr:hypothetical protein GLOIN_2v1532168 [Rhizophagus clarus]